MISMKTLLRVTFWSDLLARKVRREEEDGRRKWRACWAKNPAKTFPIKKRIDAELFADGKKGLYELKGDKESDREK